MAAPGVPVDIPKGWRIIDSMVAKAPEAKRAYRRGEGQALLAGSLAKAGLTDSARHVLARIDVPADADPTRAAGVDKAFAWILVGNKDSALAELKAVESANPNNDGFDGWRFRALRDDPRFQALKRGNGSN